MFFKILLLKNKNKINKNKEKQTLYFRGQLKSQTVYYVTLRTQNTKTLQCKYHIT
jgi:hypothetical protein